MSGGNGGGRRRISKRELKAAYSGAASRRGRRRHPNVRAAPVRREVTYVAPVTWAEAAAQSIPLDPEHRIWYVSNVNALVERALASDRGVPIKQSTAVWQKLERYRIENRERMRHARDEPLWRQHAQALFCVTCKVKFATHSAAWSRSSITGGDFYRLCKERVIVDAERPIAQYTMMDMCLALFRLVRYWSQLPYSNELALYVDHLERRVCTFLTGTFSPEVFDYPRWCMRAPPSADGGRGDMCAKQEFLTLMEIYFYEFRRELTDHDVLVASMSEEMAAAAAAEAGVAAAAAEEGEMRIPEYEAPSVEMLERSSDWVSRVADSVYEEVVMETFREAYVDSCLLIGEREYYEFENEDEEGVAQSAQSVISHFRADELDAIEGTTSLKLREALEIAGEARDLAVLSMLEFHYSSSHPGKGRSFSEEYIVQRENGSPLALAQNDPSETSRVILQRSSRSGGGGGDSSSSLSILSSSSTLVGRPVLMRVFHVWCVYDLGQGLTACGDFVTALCCWMEHAFGNPARRTRKQKQKKQQQSHGSRERRERLRARRKIFEEAEPGLLAAYRFIFKGVDEQDTEQKRADKLYEDVPNRERIILTWNPYAVTT